VGCGELIDGAQHDLPLQFLDGHAVLRKFIGEVFEQLGISWPLAAKTEVARRIHDASAKIRLPNAVSNHTHSDGLFDNQVRELHASAALVERDWVAVRENAQEMTGDLRPWSLGIPAKRERDVDRLLGILDAVNKRIV